MTDIDTLFDRIQTINSKDPSDLQPSDIDSLVEFFRYRRTRKASLQTDRDTKGLDAIMPAPKPVQIVPGAVRRFKKA
jgi:hypothetical protein